MSAVRPKEHDLYALNAANGDVRWAYPMAAAVISGPAVAGRTVYAGSGDGKVYAFNLIGTAGNISPRRSETRSAPVVQ